MKFEVVKICHFQGPTVAHGKFRHREILDYLEKIDITEEKVRLEQHCKYFIEQVENKSGQSAGRTLNFISLKMGREINTLGAKAYDADVQRLAVQMKDELEKIKEQMANVL